MKRPLIILLLLLSVTATYADAVAYGGTHEISVTQETLTFRHVHNWDSRKVDPLFSDLTRHERFFSVDNDFAYVELTDGNHGLFRSPSPALTYLWISPDAKFFVALSNIKLRNPFQLVVWRRDGTLLHREHISAVVAKLSSDQRQDFANRFPDAERFLSGRYFWFDGSIYLDYGILGVPNIIGKAAWDYLYPFRVPHPYSDDFAESVTNLVEWFDRKDPDVSITGSESDLTISLRSRTGKRMTIPLSK